MTCPTATLAKVVVQYSWLNSFRFGLPLTTRPWQSRIKYCSAIGCAMSQARAFWKIMSQKGRGDLVNLVNKIYPFWINDKDSSEEENEEGGCSVDMSNCCPCLLFRLACLPPRTTTLEQRVMEVNDT